MLLFGGPTDFSIHVGTKGVLGIHPVRAFVNPPCCLASRAYSLAGIQRVALRRFQTARYGKVRDVKVRPQRILELLSQPLFDQIWLNVDQLP